MFGHKQRRLSYKRDVSVFKLSQHYGSVDGGKCAVVPPGLLPVSLLTLRRPCTVGGLAGPAVEVELEGYFTEGSVSLWLLTMKGLGF